VGPIPFHRDQHPFAAHTCRVKGSYVRSRVHFQNAFREGTKRSFRSDSHTGAGVTVIAAFSNGRFPRKTGNVQAEVAEILFQTPCEKGARSLNQSKSLQCLLKIQGGPGHRR